MNLAERLGGAENVLWTLLQTLDRGRFEPVVIFFADGPFEREVASLGIRTTVSRLRSAAPACGRAGRPKPAFCSLRDLVGDPPPFSGCPPPSRAVE